MSEQRVLIGGALEIVTASEVGTMLDERFDAFGSRFQKHHPIRRRIPDSISFAANATSAILDFGTPPAGSVWSLLEVAVPLPAAGTAALYMGALPVNDATVPMAGDIVRTVQTLPYTFVFSKDGMVVHENEHLYLYLTHAGAQIWAGTVTVNEYPAWAVMSNLVG